MVLVDLMACNKLTVFDWPFQYGHSQIGENHLDLWKGPFLKISRKEFFKKFRKSFIFLWLTLVGLPPSYFRHDVGMVTPYGEW